MSHNAPVQSQNNPKRRGRRRHFSPYHEKLIAYEWLVLNRTAEEVRDRFQSVSRTKKVSLQCVMNIARRIGYETALLVKDDYEAFIRCQQ